MKNRKKKKTNSFVISAHIWKTEATMIKNMFVSIGRKISAHILSICVFCICLLLFGGLVQLLSSTAFSNYFDKKWSSDPDEYAYRFGNVDGTDPVIKLHLAKTYRRIAKEQQPQPAISNAIASSSSRFENLENMHKSANLKLSTEPKSSSGGGGGSGNNDGDDGNNKNNNGSKSTSTVVNSTKKTLSAASVPVWSNAINNNKEVIDWINQYNQNANNDDDTIYIDSDDDTSNSPVYEVDSQQASLEISNKNVFVSNDADVVTLPSPEPKINDLEEENRHIKRTGKHFRNKKSSKHASKTMSSYNDYRYVDGFSNFDDDGDDDIEGDVNSGSGDYSSWTEYIDLYNDFDKIPKSTNGQRQHNTIPPTKLPMPPKLRFDSHRVDMTDDKSIVEKFSRAHNRIRNANRFKNNANSNNKRKANDADSNLLDTSSITADAISKGDDDSWMETRVRRILGNIKKSEERSRQILLCKGEGELCSMLFKAPVKTAANANKNNE